MCSLFGMATSKPTTAAYSLLHAPRALRRQGAACPDGWGIAGLSDNAIWYEKEAASVAQSPRFAELANRPALQLIAHLRKRSCGRRDLYHTHPFFKDPVILAHNGAIGDWHDRIQAELGRRAGIQGATSGEHLAAWLAHRVRGSSNPTDMIATTLAELVREPLNCASANFVMLCDRTFYAFQFAPHSTNRLYYLKRNHTIVVSSRRLSNEAWVEFPQGGLLIAGPQERTSMAALSIKSGPKLARLLQV